MGIARDCRVIMAHVIVSVRATSMARISVLPIKLNCKLIKKSCSGLSFKFLTMIRNGIGSLHVTMAGLGSLASTSPLGGGVVDMLGDLLLPNMPDFCLCPPGWNAYGRLANTSFLEGGGLGGSMGRKRNPMADLLFSLNRLGRCTVTLT